MSERASVERRRYLSVIPDRRRARRCPCGCGQRASHLGMANGIALAYGCELFIRRWVRNWRDALRVLA